MAQKLVFPGRDAQSINGVPVVGTPTDQDILVFDATTGQILWQSGPGEQDYAGRVSAASFGTDVNGFYYYDVLFGTPYPPGTNYQILLGGDDQRSWSPSNITVNGFRINTNSKTPLGVGNYVYWRTKIV